MSSRLWFAALMLGIVGCGREQIERREWSVMGTIAAVQWSGAVDGERSVQMVKTVFAEVNRLLNAHDPNSELSRLAPLTDAQVLAKCDESVRECYQAAFQMRELTAGRFNPRYRGTNTMDLGAIAKGFAVDLAAQRLRELSLVSADGRILIDLGGNLKAVGGAWKVGIDKADEAFELPDGAACATSARYYRGNHIKDGRTGGDIDSGVRAVTVVHPTSAMLADGLSTVMFLLGRQSGENFIKTRFSDVSVFWTVESEEADLTNHPVK